MFFAVLVPASVSVLCMWYIFSGTELFGGHDTGPVFASDQHTGSWSEWIPSLDRIGALGILFWFLKELLGVIREYLPEFVKSVVEISKRLRLVERECSLIREELSEIGVGKKTVFIKQDTDSHPVPEPSNEK